MKFKITKTTESIEEVEVNLPIYVKNKHLLYYKVFSEEQALFVGAFAFAGGEINVVSSSIAFSEGYEQIEASEFEEVFDKVINELKKLR